MRRRRWRSSSCCSPTASRRADASAPAKPKRSVGRILLDMVLVLRNGRFTLYLVVMTGFYFLYNQVYNVLPLYVKTRRRNRTRRWTSTPRPTPSSSSASSCIITQHVRQDEADQVDGRGHGHHRRRDADQHRADLHRPAARAPWRPTGCPSRRVFIILTVALIALRRAVHLAAHVRVHRRAGAQGAGGPVPRLREPAARPRRAARRPGRRLHLQRDHEQGRDRQAGGRPARTRARAERAGLDHPDGDRPRLGGVAVAVQPLARATEPRRS